jgi:sugar lactone lactonase YvrE
MKSGLFLFLFFLSSWQVQAQHGLQKLWESDTILQIPESVLYDAGRQILYVSLIDGPGNVKDGKGGIAMLHPDGTIADTGWITGLNAPKGLGQYGNKLYVADLDEVVVIDIPGSKIEKKIPVPGSVFLNDITIDPHGTVYVSDTRKNKIFRIEQDRPSVYIDSVAGPNGLLFENNSLYVLASGSLLQYDAQKQVTQLASGMEKSTDGLVMVQPGEFVATAWVGVVYYVAGGTVQELLNVKADKINTADLAYDAARKLLYIPTFNHKNIITFRLQ